MGDQSRACSERDLTGIKKGLCLKQIMISEEDLEHAYWNSAQSYPWRVNQLGGRYINGKPLPIETRLQILYCARNGVRPCDISRQMKITHGCISKLLAKFKRTGSMVPGSVNSKHTFTDHEVDDALNEPRKTLNTKESHNQNRAITSEQSRACEVTETERTVWNIEQWTESRTAVTNITQNIENQSRGDGVKDEMPSCGKEKSEEMKPYKHSIDEILCNTTTKENSEVRLKETIVTPKWDVKKQFAPPATTPRKSSQRTHFSRAQLQVLHKEFLANQYPGLAERQQLAKELDVQESKIRIWFSNRRAKCRQSSREFQDYSIVQRSEAIELCCSTGYPCTCYQSYVLHNGH